MLYSGRIQLLITALLCFAHTLAAHSPKREFRAAWIATVSNIDWPSKRGLSSMEQQQEFIRQLDKLQDLGCNAVIVQIRPACDAFYDSPYEPWSRYLTGKQGQPPSPYYDPLQFMVEQAHLRNMEFHAWFNPFRALTNSQQNPNPPDHVTRKHPEWVIPYGTKSYLDPGEPEARAYVIRVVMDVVKRYDIDGVHLDDYFYPYRIAGKEFGDQRSFSRYKGSFTQKDDWRRNNVSLFVADLYEAIKKEKQHIKFGISPFGVWRNASKDPEGSATRGGQTCYDDLYADIRLWMKKGWIDYCLPQLYWEHNHRAAPFEVLLPWWEANSYDRHVYYGLGVYRMVEATKGPWTNTAELLWQIRDIRTQTAHPGHVFYSTSCFDKIKPAVADSIRNRYNKHIAFPPPMKWLDSIAPAAPVVKKEYTREGALLRWEAPNPSREKLRYAVYRFEPGERIQLNDPSKIISLQNGTEFLDAGARLSHGYSYVVTALDRLWNESRPGFTDMNANIEKTDKQRF